MDVNAAIRVKQRRFQGRGHRGGSSALTFATPLQPNPCPLLTSRAPLDLLPAMSTNTTLHERTLQLPEQRVECGPDLIVIIALDVSPAGWPRQAQQQELQLAPLCAVIAQVLQALSGLCPEPLPLLISGSHVLQSGSHV